MAFNLFVIEYDKFLCSWLDFSTSYNYSSHFKALDIPQNINSLGYEQVKINDDVVGYHHFLLDKGCDL